MGFDPVRYAEHQHHAAQARAEYDADLRSRAAREAAKRTAANRSEYRARALTLPHELCDLVTSWTEAQAGNPKQFGQALLDAVVRNDLTHLRLIVELRIRDDAEANADKVSADDVLDGWRKDAEAQARADFAFDPIDDARMECHL